MLHTLTDGMDVAYGIAVSGGLILLTEEQLDPMGVTADGLRAAALRNLRTLGVRPKRLSGTIIAFSGGKHPLLNAAQVVLEHPMRAIALRLGMRAIDVAVPSPDLALAYLPRDANRAALPLTAALLHRLSDDRLTPRILHCRYSSGDDQSAGAGPGGHAGAGSAAEAAQRPGCRPDRPCRLGRRESAEGLGPRRALLVTAASRSPEPLRAFVATRSISRILSRAIISLGCRSPGTSSGQPGRSAGRVVPPLFGLAAGGVCLAGRLPARRCALTAPFHPCRASAAV